MWLCVKCRASLDDGFDVCWNCGTSSEGVVDRAFRKADEIPAEAFDDPAEPTPSSAPEEATAIQVLPHAGDSETSHAVPLDCLRCGRAMKFLGTRWIENIGGWDALLHLGDGFDVYTCPRCGRAEFFLSGVGEAYRPRKASE